MANRRNLKKSIKYICGEPFADCVALNRCGQADKEKIETLMANLLVLHGDYVSRLSHCERGHGKVFFKKLREDFTREINELADKIVKA